MDAEMMIARLQVFFGLFLSTPSLSVSCFRQHSRLVESMVSHNNGVQEARRARQNSLSFVKPDYTLRSRL